MLYLKEWRTQAGLSQEALAHKAGVSVSTISRAERDPFVHSHPAIVGKIEEALGSGPFGLRQPPPGTPTRDERDLVELVMALHRVSENAESMPEVAAFRRDGKFDGEDDELAFANWVLNHPDCVAKGLTLDAQQLRDSASFLVRLADAVEELRDSSENG